MKIRVTCEGTEYINYQELREFQGRAKELHPTDLSKLKDSIKQYGFTAPVFVWESKKVLWILDGHQRLKAVASLEAEGYEVPLIPIVRIKADSKKQATEKLLAIGSQYGVWNAEAVASFAKEHDMDINAEHLSLLKVGKETQIAIDQQFVDIDDFFEKAGQAKESKGSEHTCPHCGTEFVV
jgi:hypothetical protein